MGDCSTKQEQNGNFNGNVLFAILRRETKEGRLRALREARIERCEGNVRRASAEVRRLRDFDYEMF